MSVFPPASPTERALLDAVFAHAPVGLGFWDEDVRYRRLNEPWRA